MVVECHRPSRVEACAALVYRHQQRDLCSIPHEDASILRRG